MSSILLDHGFHEFQYSIVNYLLVTDLFQKRKTLIETKPKQKEKKISLFVTLHFKSISSVSALFVSLSLSLSLSIPFPKFFIFVLHLGFLLHEQRHTRTRSSARTWYWAVVKERKIKRIERENQKDWADGERLAARTPKVRIRQQQQRRRLQQQYSDRKLSGRERERVGIVSCCYLLFKPA